MAGKHSETGSSSTLASVSSSSRTPLESSNASSISQASASTTSSTEYTNLSPGVRTGPEPGSTSSSESSPTQTIISKSSGISSGGAAGIAIGCLLAGFLIGAITLFFIMRRKSQRRPHYHGDYPPAPPPVREKPAAVTTGSSFDADSAVAIVENNLPQPVEDQAILNDMVKLQNTIKNHISSYYHKSPTQANANLEAIDALGGEMPIPGASLNALLGNPGTRAAALRFCIAWAALYRASLYSDPSESFLPPGVSSCLSEMSGIENNPRAQQAFMSKWRAITSTLMKPYTKAHFSSSDDRLPNITKCLTILDAIVLPYADTRHSPEHRRKNLEEILKRAASFGFLLFSQPTNWHFSWDEPRGQGGGNLVIFPALLQTCDEEGRELRPPRMYGQVDAAPAAEWRA